MAIIDPNKPKTVVEYEKYLNGRERRTLLRFERFLALISETRDIAPFDLYPDELFIEKTKFNRRTLLFGDAWNILYLLSESFLSVFPTQPIFHEESKSKNLKGLAIRYQRDEEPYATNLKNFQTALSNVYGGASIFKKHFVQKRLEALSHILVGLFRDDLFHKLDDREGAEFYIDILDEVLADDKELDRILELRRENAEGEEFKKEFSKISEPYIEDIKNKFRELEKDGWIKVKSIDLKVLQSGNVETTVVDGTVIPAGKLLTIALAVKATKISWRKFIEFVSERCEKGNLDWDNIYSTAKQKSLIIQKINERRKDLDRDEGIILQLPPSFYDGKRIHMLKTLEGLEVDGFITLSGFKICKSDDVFDKLSGTPGYFVLKTEIAVTRKFKERIQEIEDEAAKNLLMKKSHLNQKQKKEDSKPAVVIDSRAGIYLASHYDKPYEISGKRKKVVEYLVKNDVVPLSELISLTDQQNPLMVKEIGEINKNFRNIGAKMDLIVRSKTAGGYSLNKREFTIETPETST